MKHKHADLIHAWANGATIEGRFPGGEWKLAVPYWLDEFEYRVKPEPKPYVVRYAGVYPEGGIGPPCINIDSVKFGVVGAYPVGIIRIVIDGECGYLAAEVVE